MKDYNSPEHIRNQQQSGNQAGEPYRHSPRIKKAPPKPRAPMSQHEVPLSSMLKHNSMVELVMMSGQVYVGEMAGFDPYTISLRFEGKTRPTTFFKHAIESFTAYEGDADE